MDIILVADKIHHDDIEIPSHNHYILPSIFGSIRRWIDIKSDAIYIV